MNTCTSNYYCCFDKTQSDIFPYHTKPLKSPSNLQSSQLLRTFDDRKIDDNKENPFIQSECESNFEGTVMMVQKHRINNSVIFMQSTKSHTPNIQSLKNSQKIPNNEYIKLESSKPFQELRTIVNNSREDKMRNIQSQHNRTSNSSCISQDFQLMLNQQKLYEQIQEKEIIQFQKHKKNITFTKNQQHKQSQRKVKHNKNLSSQHDTSRPKPPLKQKSNSNISNHYISVISQQSQSQFKGVIKNHYNSISSSSSQSLQSFQKLSQRQYPKQKIKKVANNHSQYLTKNINQSISSNNIVNKPKLSHRHNISSNNLQQQSSLCNFHIKNKNLVLKQKMSQSIDKDSYITIENFNSITPINNNSCRNLTSEKERVSSQNMSLYQQEYYSSQTIDGRKTVNILPIDKSINLNRFLPKSQKQHSKQSHAIKRYEQYQKGKIFFTRFNGRGYEDNDDQEVHDYDSNQCHQDENILDEENIPVRNRESVISNIKSFNTNYDVSDLSEHSNESIEQIEQTGVKTNRENKHKFKSNYNSRNNDSIKGLVRVSSETTVKNFMSLETKLSAIREAHNTISIQELHIKKRKIIQDKLRSNYGNKVNQIQRDMLQKTQGEKQSEEELKSYSILEKEIQNIKDFEFILQQFSENQKQKNILSIDDLGHALYLMKFFVAYPRNYAGIKFTDGMQLQLYLKEKEVLLQLWNLLKPQPIQITHTAHTTYQQQSYQSQGDIVNETKRSFKYCVYSKALSLILSLAVDQLAIEDYRQIYQNYVTQLMKDQNSLTLIQQTSQSSQLSSQDSQNNQSKVDNKNEMQYTASKYYLDRDDRWELRKIIMKLKEIKKNNIKYTKNLEIKSLGQAQVFLSNKDNFGINDKNIFHYKQVNIDSQSKASVVNNIDNISTVENQRIREILSMKLKLTPMNKWELNFLDQK